MSIDVKDIEEKRKQLCSIIMAVNDALGRFKAIAGQNDTETEQIQKHSRFLLLVSSKMVRVLLSMQCLGKKCFLMVCCLVLP